MLLRFLCIRVQKQINLYFWSMYLSRHDMKNTPAVFWWTVLHPGTSLIITSTYKFIFPISVNEDCDSSLNKCTAEVIIDSKHDSYGSRIAVSWTAGQTIVSKYFTPLLCEFREVELNKILRLSIFSYSVIPSSGLWAITPVNPVRDAPHGSNPRGTWWAIIPLTTHTALAN